MKKNIILIISLFIITILNLQNTYACSCMIPPWPNEAKNMATNVFIWTVSGIEEKSSFNSYDKYKIKLSWIKNIKWEWSDVKTVYTAQSSATCWFNFEEWKEYIVYTNWEEWSQNVSLCSRTALTYNAQEDIKEFDNIIEKNKNTSNIEEKEIIENKTNIKIIYIISFLLLIILLLITFIKYKKIRD